MRGLIARYEQKSAVPDKAGERYVPYDESRKEALPREPTLAGRIIGRRIVYFGVKIDQPSENEQVTASIEVGNMRDAQFRIRYRTSIPEDGALRVVQKLGHLKDPVEEFERLLKRWLRRYYEANPNAAQRFLQTRDQAIRFLINEAEEEVGVRLSCEIELSGADPRDTTSIHVPDLDLKVRSYTPQIVAELKCDIDVDPEGYGLAAARGITQEQIEWELQRSVRAYVLENEPLDSLCFDIAGVNERLSRHISSELRPFGRKVRHAEISIVKGPPAPPRSLDIVNEPPVQVRVIDSNEPVPIQHHLVLNLVDFVTFARVRRVEPDKIKDWFRELLESVAIDEAHGKRYADLVLNFDEDAIRRRIQDAAREIGYDVKVFAGLPAVEAIEMRDQPQLFEKELQLDTREIARPVDLAIDLRYRLEDLEALRKRIRPGRHLKKEIEDEIEQCAKEVVSRLDAGQFYFYFNIPPDPANPIHPTPEWNVHSETIEAHIRRAIESRLQTEFRATVERLNLRPAQGSISERVNHLRKSGVQRLPIKGIANLYESGNAVPVDYTVYYQILGVDKDNWPAFLAKNPAPDEEYSVDVELAEIDALLEGSLRRRLKTMSAERIQFLDERGRLEMLRLLNEATDPARAAFGLVVSLVEVDREATSEEVAGQMRHGASVEALEYAIEKELEDRKALIAARSDEIRALLEERRQIVRAEPNNTEAIRDIEERIRQLSPPRSVDRSDRQPLLPRGQKRRRGSDLDEPSDDTRGRPGPPIEGGKDRPRVKSAPDTRNDDTDTIH